MIRKLKHLIDLYIYYLHEITIIIGGLFLVYIATMHYGKIIWLIIKYVSLSIYNSILPLVNIFIKEKVHEIDVRGIAMELSENLQISRFPRKTSYILLLVIFASFIIALGIGPKNKNEILTEGAWIAYNDGKYEEAVKKADECISEFGNEAWEQQKTLASQKTPLPPEGEASIYIKKEEKEAIFKRGVLNDVGTCWYIKAISLEKLNRLDEAKKAYKEAAKFTYSRTWDPAWKGFWSPAKKAKSKLENMEKIE